MIVENAMAVDGAGVWVNHHRIFSMRDSTFSTSVATGRGGALYATGGVIVRVYNSSLLGNRAAYGAGMYVGVAGHACDVYPTPHYRMMTWSWQLRRQRAGGVLGDDKLH